MLFNSIDFAIFLPIVFAAYWFVLGHSFRGQNAVLIVSGAVFYGWWDARYLLLLLFTSGVDYLVALGLERRQETSHRRCAGLGLHVPNQIKSRPIRNGSLYKLSNARCDLYSLRDPKPTIWGHPVPQN